MSKKKVIAISITLTNSEYKQEFNGCNAWLRNDGTSTVYASFAEGITIGGSNVISIPAGCSAPVFGANGTVYMLGNGTVQLIGNDYSTNPFNTSTGSSGSAVDEQARTAITAHTGNTNIHVTPDEKALWNNKAGLADIPDINNLMQNLNTWTSGDIKNLTLNSNSGCVFIYADVTGMPIDNSYWFGIVNASTTHRNLIVFQIDGLYSGFCSYNSANNLWSNWKSFADAGDASTLQTHPATDFVLQTDFNELVDKVDSLIAAQMLSETT